MTQQRTAEGPSPEQVVRAWIGGLEVSARNLRQALLEPPAEVLAAAARSEEARDAMAWARFAGKCLAVQVLILGPEMQRSHPAPAPELEELFGEKPTRDEP